MRIIDVPVDVVKITFRLQAGQEIKKDYQFFEFLRDAVDSNQAFGKSLSNARQGHRLLGEIEKVKPGEPMRLEDADYEALKSSVENCQYNPMVATRVVAYYEAIHNAQDVKTATRREL